MDRIIKFHIGDVVYTISGDPLKIICIKKSLIVGFSSKITNAFTAKDPCNLVSNIDYINYEVIDINKEINTGNFFLDHDLKIYTVKKSWVFEDTEEAKIYLHDVINNFNN